MPNNADTVWGDTEDKVLAYLATKLGVTEDVQLFTGDDVAAAGMTNVLMFGISGGPDQLQNIGSTEGNHGSWHATARINGLFDKRRDAINLGSKILNKSPFIGITDVQTLYLAAFPTVRTVEIQDAGRRAFAYELVADFGIAFDVTES